MLRILTAVILIPLVLLAIFKAPLWAYGLLVIALALVATYEYLDIVAAYGLAPMRVLTLITVVAAMGGPLLGLMARMRNPFVSAHLEGASRAYSATLLLASAAPLLMLVLALRSDDLKIALPSAATSYLGIPYIALTLGFLVYLRASVVNGTLAVLYLLLVVWSGDIAAYYVGKTLGKHPLSPRVSPKKTWEGAVASLLVATSIGTLLLMFNGKVAALADRMHALPQSSIFGSPQPGANVLWIALLISAAINIAAQLGDLVESMIKRGADVKDSGFVLPGHGGVLDRIDALLFAAPMLWYFVSYTSQKGQPLIHF